MSCSIGVRREDEHRLYTDWDSGDDDKDVGRSAVDSIRMKDDSNHL